MNVYVPLVLLTFWLTPAPTPKTLYGTWDMTWDNTEWSITFNQSGYCITSGHGIIYIGRYVYTPAYSKLSVRESDGTAEATWETYLDSNYQGEVLYERQGRRSKGVIQLRRVK